MLPEASLFVASIDSGMVTGSSIDRQPAVTIWRKNMYKDKAYWRLVQNFYRDLFSFVAGLLVGCVLARLVKIYFRIFI